MSNKWRRFAEQLVDAVKPGGVERSTLGASINVSANGTGTVTTSDLERVVFKRFEEMRSPGSRADDAPASKSEVG